MSFIHRLILLAALLNGSSVFAETVLPEKLSFDQAMKIVDQGKYYDVLLAQADAESVMSDLLKINGQNGFKIDMVALAQYVEASEVVAQSSNEDHKLSVLMTKNLLDSGYSDKKEQSAETKLKSIRLLMQQIRLKKRIEVAEKFFAIKLSDMKFALDNEAISTAYVKFHKTQERNSLKQSSDVDLLDAQFEYQKVRARRYESETMQRISRARFSESIARPNDLPVDVIVPDLSFLKRKRPEYEDLVKLALSNNLQLQAQKLQVESAVHELAASKKAGGSTLTSELEWAEYTYETPSRNNWRAAIKFTMPLYENDAVKSLRASALSNLQRQRIKLRQTEAEIRQQVLENWQRIYVLNAHQDTDAVAEEYRELYQDRSRAFYEMEFRTDLGDSFVRVSEARFEKFKNNFELFVTWMKLAMLTGTTLEEYIQQ
ncbi:MAG: TolC family protein [Gammaproteobacteria bacterium]|nr:TolC family protein [Gammaproteobacteria bacterium]